MKNMFAHSHSRSRYLLTVSLLAILSATTALGAQSADQADEAKSTQLSTSLRRAKIVDASYKLTASVSSDEILITTQKKPKANETELKIEAVLLSKVAFDTVTSGPQRVKLMFLDIDNGVYNQVLVKRAEVMLFGEGKLSQKDLLASLEVTSSEAVVEEGAQETAALPGPMQAERMMTLARINRIKARGTNVTQFMKLFDQLEDAARKDEKNEVSKQVMSLNARLKDQEDLLKSLAQRKQTSLQSTATPTHTESSPGGSSLLSGGGLPNVFASLFNSIAEQRIANYPKDMKETSTRLLIELKYMADHEGHSTTGYKTLEYVGHLMDEGRQTEARSVLNQLAPIVDSGYNQQLSRAKGH